MEPAKIIKSEYKGDAIQVLEGLQAVRRRPGMYIGDTGPRGFHHLLWEILDNSVDEALAGFCGNIRVALYRDGSISVTDDGRGMPPDIHPQKGIPACEVVFTVLHAGGKFDSGAYGIAGGLHGVGASVVNALSEWLELTVWRDSREYSMKFARGETKEKLKSKPSSDKTKRGTMVRFLPDNNIFTEAPRFAHQTIERKLREISYLVPGLSLVLATEQEDGSWSEEGFCNRNGIEAMVVHLGKNSTPLFEGVVSLSGSASLPLAGGVHSGQASEGACTLRGAWSRQATEVDVAFRYLDDYAERLHSFANLIPTPEGGTHVTGFRTALTRAVNESARAEKILKEREDNISGEDLREGLLCVLSVKLQNPQFEGQTKGKLGNSETAGAVSAVVYEKLSTFFANEGKGVLKIIVEKAVSSRRAREAAKKAKDLVRGRSSGGARIELPGKLADCSSKDAERAEIFIVEGDSAGGSAKQGRDRRFQAILPLRGKILNVEKARMDRILSNNEITSIIKALGCGVGAEFDSDKLRYGKVIIMTDADVDGAHIRTLLLTLFYRLFPELVSEGRIYAARPPLYQVRRGKEVRYLYSDAELGADLEKNKKGTAVIQRYKGLGEMSPEQLWETTMNPEGRTLRRISVAEGVAEAEEMLDTLMGSDPGPRREFIFANGAEARALDV